MRAVDHYELTGMVVLGEQLTTHRLETVTEFVRLEIVERTPERRPIGDVLWLDVVEHFSERMIPAKAAFEGDSFDALELPQNECRGSFRGDRLDLRDRNREKGRYEFVSVEIAVVGRIVRRDIGRLVGFALGQLSVHQDDQLWV